MSGMNRAAIWKWYLENTPAKSKSGKTDASDEKLVKVKAVLDMEGDRIIIGMWGGQESTPCGVYYMTPSGVHWWSQNGKWQRGKVEYVPKDGYQCWKAYPRNKYRWIGDAKTVIDRWVESHFGDQAFFCHWKGDPIDKLDDVERNLSRIQKNRTTKRRRTRISDWVHTLPAQPADLGEWAGRVVFGDRHYAIGSKGEAEFRCTNCRQDFTAENWRNNKWYVCPVCSAKVQARKSWCSYRADHGRVSVYLPHQDMNGRACVSMVTLYAEKRWSTDGEFVSFTPARVAVLPKDGEACAHGNLFYNHRCDEWDSVNTWGFKCSEHFLYPFDPSVLDGTYYEGISKVLLAASLRGWRLNWDLFMYCHSRVQVYEYLIKGGFERLVRDTILDVYTSDGARLKWNGEDAEEVLMIDRQRINRLRTANGGILYLDWLRTDFMCGYRLKDALLQWLSKNITPTELAFALYLPGMTVERAVNYIKKQIELHPREYVSSGTCAEHFARLWRDYLGVAKSLGIDLSQEYNFKPKDLRARHDELNDLIAIQRRRAQLEAEKAALAEKASKMEAKYPKVAPVCARVRELYEWGDGTYLVKVPAGAWDVMQEGVLQSHCTSRDEENVYLERIEQETSYIMFLRKADKPDSPWYTMEVEPGGNVIQLRTYGDKEGTDRAEAKAFLGKWRREIAGRLGQGELTKTQKSREELLKYWDGLRKGGNIIRRGHLQGKLLVEVLQADYKELNGELPKEEVG